LVLLPVVLGLTACGSDGSDAKPAAEPPAEESVLVYIPMRVEEGSDLDEVFALEEALIEAIDAADAGTFDGNEVGGGEVVLFMYGPDAEVLFAAVEPVLREASLPEGAYVVLSSGEDGSEDRRVDL
jgi:hypothetical protein